MFDRIKKHFAIKACMKKLTPLLVKRYGDKNDYTSGQVQTTARIAGLNEKYLFYGYAIFCTKETFDQQALEYGNQFGYQTLRQEVGNKYFDGDANFLMTDVTKINYEMGYGTNDGGGLVGGDSGVSGSSGGDCGGGGDGC